MKRAIKVLRKLWKEAIHDTGEVCPVCDRWGKVYPRNINQTMAESLIWLVSASRDVEWVDVPNIAPKKIVRSNQLPTLRWWGLVERAPNDDPHKKFSGFWRPTALGRKFVHGQEKVSQKVFTYNNEVLGFGDDKISIGDCFGEIFDYHEVMRANKF